MFSPSISTDHTPRSKRDAGGRRHGGSGARQPKKRGQPGSHLQSFRRVRHRPWPRPIKARKPGGVLNPSSRLMNTVSGLPFVDYTGGAAKTRYDRTKFPVVHKSTVTVSMKSHLMESIRRQSTIPTCTTEATMTPMNVSSIIHVPRKLGRNALTTLPKEERQNVHGDKNSQRRRAGDRTRRGRRLAQLGDARRGPLRSEKISITMYYSCLPTGSVWRGLLGDGLDFLGCSRIVVDSSGHAPQLRSFHVTYTVTSTALYTATVTRITFSLGPTVRILSGRMVTSSPTCPTLTVSALIPTIVNVTAAVLDTILI